MSTEQLDCVMEIQCILSVGSYSVYRVKQGKLSVQYLPSDATSTEFLVYTKFETTLSD